MPTEKTIKLYEYHELSERAKAKARDWYLSTIYWPEEVEPEIDNWRELAEKLGFTVESGPWWDADRGEFDFSGDFKRPSDSDLSALAKDWSGSKDVAALIGEVAALRPGLWGSFDWSRVDAVELSPDDIPSLMAFMVNNEVPEDQYEAYDAHLDALEREEKFKLEDALSSICSLGLNWIRNQIDYIESEDYIADCMEANEWLFHEDGTRAWRCEG